MTKRIIVFNGPPGSGKDTAANIARVALYNENLHVTALKMSDPIKEAVHRLYGLFFEPKYYDNHKDGLKDVVHPLLFGLTPRQMYIKLSDMIIAEWGDAHIGDITANKLHNNKNPVAIFSDSGIIGEWHSIIKWIGAENVLWIELMTTKNGKQLTFEGDSRNYIGDDLKALYPKLTVKRLPNDITDDPLDKELFGEMVKGTVNNFFKDMYRDRPAT